MLPRMTAALPVIVPPTAGDEYPDYYNTLLLVRPLQDTATLKFAPFNFDTQQVLSDSARELTVTTNEFLAFVAARPTLAQAVAALIAELGKVAQEADLERRIAAEQAKESPDQAQLDAWQTQLAGVRVSMGCAE